MGNSVIEQELAESPLLALCKYARHILAFHIQGFMRAERPSYEEA
jgi:hypothetical protein